jgi:hypothetical protein
MIISRVQLGDLVGLTESPTWKRERVDGWPSVREPSQYVVVWDDVDHSLPHAIIIPTSEEEFYAWSVAYLPNLSPLSSAIEVIQTGATRRGSRFPVRTETFGLCMAEVSGARGAVADDDDVTIVEFRGTLTYALMQNARFGAKAPEEVARAWEEARSVLRLRRGAFSDDVLAVWNATTVRTGETSQPTLFAAADGIVYPDVDWRSAATALLGSRDADLIPPIETGPLEDRVRRFRDLVRWAHATAPDLEGDVAMVLGGALSRLSDGSFRHPHLVGPREVNNVRPLLWYGWFEAAAARSRSEGWIGGAAGLRLRKEVMLSASEHAHSCDVALEELRVINRTRQGIEPLVAASSGRLRVRLSPGIVSEFSDIDRLDRLASSAQHSLPLDALRNGAPSRQKLSRRRDR